VKFTALNNKSQFAYLRKEEFCYNASGLKVFIKENLEESSRLGISISSRFANAVNRNKFKRRIREVVRGLDSELNLDIYIEGNKEASKLPFSNIENIILSHPLLSD